MLLGINQLEYIKQMLICVTLCKWNQITFTQRNEVWVKAFSVNDPLRIKKDLLANQFYSWYIALY